jgi:CRP/FNR family transcriptional regulator, cyclic AMP receptor protein
MYHEQQKFVNCFTDRWFKTLELHRRSRLEVYNQRLQQMHQTIHDLVSERAIVRLAHLLQTQVNSDGAQLNVKLSHHQIARSIGITYEECVRLFSQLKTVVSYQRGGIIRIVDREMLDKIANGSIDLKSLNCDDR